MSYWLPDPSSPSRHRHVTPKLMQMSVMKVIILTTTSAPKRQEFNQINPPSKYIGADVSLLVKNVPHERWKQRNCILLITMLLVRICIFVDGLSRGGLRIAYNDLNDNRGNATFNTIDATIYILSSWNWMLYKQVDVRNGIIASFYTRSYLNKDNATTLESSTFASCGA